MDFLLLIRYARLRSWFVEIEQSFNKMVLNDKYYIKKKIKFLLTYIFFMLYKLNKE